MYTNKIALFNQLHILNECLYAEIKTKNKTYTVYIQKLNWTLNIGTDELLGNNQNSKKLCMIYIAIIESRHLITF